MQCARDSEPCEEIGAALPFSRRYPSLVATFCVAAGHDIAGGYKWELH